VCCDSFVLRNMEGGTACGLKLLESYMSVNSGDSNGFNGWGMGGSGTVASGAVLGEWTAKASWFVGYCRCSVIFASVWVPVEIFNARLSTLYNGSALFLHMAREGSAGADQS
jgi:hypothetical protein